MQFYNLMVWVVRNSVSSPVGNEYLNVLVRALQSVAVSLFTALQCYPLFACVEAPIRLVGYLLGSLYSDIYAVYLMYSMNYNLKYYKSQNAYAVGVVRVVALLPQLICLVIVLVWYHAKAITESIRVCSLGRDALFFRTEQSLHEEYVRDLLTGWKSSAGTGKKLDFGKGFRFPFPFLVVIVIVTILILQLTAQVIIISVYGLNQAAAGDPSNNVYQKMIAVMVLMPLAAAVFVYGLFFHLVYAMRKKMKGLWAGKNKCDIDFHHINHPSLILASAVRYAGVQIASVILAWIIFTALFVLVGLFIVMLSESPSTFGFIIYFLIMTVLWTAGVMGAQLLIVKFFFIHQESHNTHTIVIHNRRAFSCFAYVVLLYNILVGIVFTLLRLMLSCLITATMLSRMDRSLMIGGFEFTDFGLRFYKSFITVETLLGNPVASTFVNLLKKRSGCDTSQPTSIQDWSHESTYGAAFGESKERYSRRILNRWMVAYTLINNRSLVSLRARNINTSDIAIHTDENVSEETSLLVGISNTGSK